MDEQLYRIQLTETQLNLLLEAVREAAQVYGGPLLDLERVISQAAAVNRYPPAIVRLLK